MADITSSADIFTVLSSQQDLRDSAANTALSSGISLMENKKYAEAARAFKMASAYKPELTQAYTFQGDAYARLGKKPEAAAAYELSLKVDSSQSTVYSSLANVYVDMGKTTDAIKTLQKAVKANNLNTPAYYTLGLLQAKNGDYKSAEAQFRQVIRIEPKDGNGYYALGMALNGQGKNQDAIRPLEQAITLKKDFDTAITELGKAYIKLGETDKVQTQIDKLNKIGTSNAAFSAADLADQIRKPGIFYYNAIKSSLQLSSGPVNLLSLDPIDSTDFTTAGASKNVTVTFAFDSSMDPASVMNVTNWTITKAAGGTAGIYDNGTYSPKNVPIPLIPMRVTYDPASQEATLTFAISQNSTVDGKIDPSHLVFRFKGTDANGATMDSTADQYDGFKSGAF